MPVVASDAESHGLTITHKWWLVEGTYEDDTPEKLDYLRTCAILDFEGVRSADAVLLINSGKSEGKAVEQGIAIALMKPIVVVGKRGQFSQNVFHYLPNYFWNDTLEEALNCLDSMKDQFNG